VASVRVCKLQTRTLDQQSSHVEDTVRLVFYLLCRKIKSVWTVESRCKKSSYTVVE